MNLNDLLHARGIDPQNVLIMRHRPREPELNRVLPWLAAERADVFNAYQQAQGPKVERSMHAMEGRGHVASFIGHEAGKALFVGLYAIAGSTPISRDKFWEVPGNIELGKLGMNGFADDDGRQSFLWFDLTPTPFYMHWKGKMVIGWPPPELSWCRRAHKNEMPILAVREECALEAAMPEWHKIVLTWDQLRVVPTRWKAAISQWRGIYFIFDASDAKGYVGSACGEGNILSRWMNYAASGHGGNRLLRPRDPRNFRFSILQRVSPDTEIRDVVELENSWKERLHTRDPHGLNDN